MFFFFKWFMSSFFGGVGGLWHVFKCSFSLKVYYKYMLILGFTLVILNLFIVEHAVAMFFKRSVLKFKARSLVAYVESFGGPCCPGLT